MSTTAWELDDVAGDGLQDECDAGQDLKHAFYSIEFHVASHDQYVSFEIGGIPAN